MIGTRLGPYDIVAVLGAGGMGEVYRARDRRLDRDVAIKVLPPHLSASAEFRERFEREAKAISQLNHPHICTLHDVGHENGTSYLVMELLEGETLADRLSKGPLPIEGVLRYGTHVAEALDRAHRQGIVHRDLKPGNIMITKSGAKLLDFGLAKGAATASGMQQPGLSILHTEQKPLTAEGTIIGTFQYMAPEQLEGLEADARTDIFALGTVLYEMATGVRAFDGKTKTSLIAAIVSSEPAPMSRIQPITPPALEHVVAKCLEKDPDQRWQSAHDIAQELAWISRSSGQMAAVGSHRTRSRTLGWLAAGIAGLLLGAAATWLTTRSIEKPAPVARFVVPLPQAAPVDLVSEPVVAVSPDGTRIVYRGKDGDDARLYMRGIGALVPVPLAGTEGARTPAFSPDGRSILFSSSSRLKKLSLAGGLPVDLAPTRGGNLGSHWFRDTIYYNSGFTAGIMAIPENGGTPRQVIKTDPARGMRAIVWPQMLPDGKTLIATVWNNGSWDEARINAFPMDGGAPRTLINGGSCARYLSTGHLLYQRGGTLFAAPFDARKAVVTGAALPVMSRVATGVQNGEAHYAVSGNGTLVYVPGGLIDVKSALVWVDRKGNEQPVVPTLRPYGEPRLSPDGRTIAVTMETSMFDIWLLDIERDSLTRVSFSGDDFSAAWSRDGRRVFWQSSRTGHTNIYFAAADGSSGEQRLTVSDTDHYVREMSPDGRYLLATAIDPRTESDIVIVPLDGDRKFRPFLATRFNESGGSFSPDGKWILYSSDESGRSEIYVRPFPGPGGKWQISVGGADGGHFTRDGREIFYQSGRKYYVVPIQMQPEVRVGRPQFLFEKQGSSWTDIALDSQRLLMVRETTPPASGELHIVLNWFEELKQRFAKN